MQLVEKAYLEQGDKRLFIPSDALNKLEHNVRYVSSPSKKTLNIEEFYARNNEFQQRKE